MARAAAAALGRLPYAGHRVRLERPLARGSLVILAPFLLADAFPFEGALGAARTLALANAFGAAHFLAQDRLLDGDEAATPEACAFSDHALAFFIRENARLFGPDHPFWWRLSAYLDEYFESLAWERAVLRTPQGRDAVRPGALAATLCRLGRRMSPLKACAAGIALLSDREHLIPALEELIESYHAAFQLTDDLIDLRCDLEKKRWSTVAWMAAEGSGVDLAGGGIDADALLALAAGSGALGEVAGLVEAGYARAADLAGRAGASLLADHLARAGGHTVASLRWQSRRAASVLRVRGAAPVRPGAGPPAALSRPRPGLHAFRVHGSGFVYDPRTALFFHADTVALDVVGEIEHGAGESSIDVLRMNHGRAAVDEALAEVAALVEERAVQPSRAAVASGCGSCAAPVFGEAPCGAAPAPGEEPCAAPTPGAITTIALHVSERCNLSCDYCYLGSGDRGGFMSEDVAMRAIELLFDESLAAPRVSVVFFGGEPLLALDLMEKVAERVRGRAEAEGRAASFHVTTNGTLLTADVAARLAAAGVGILVSVDGDRAGHDAHRRFADGAGSYDVIARNLAALPRGFRVGARATVTADSPPLPDLVRHLAGLGFSTVHISPVSGPPMSQSFSTRLCEELDRLALEETERLRAGTAPVVGNLLEGVLALETGQERRLPCGAGSAYVSVAADGTLYLCHRFAGDASRAVGDVVEGFDPAAARGVLGDLLRAAQGCRGCWARALCGGPCYHDLARSAQDTAGAAAPRCRVRRRLFELSMWMYAMLPERAARKLADAAARAARPELGPPRQATSPCGERR